MYAASIPKASSFSFVAIPVGTEDIPPEQKCYLSATTDPTRFFYIEEIPCKWTEREKEEINQNSHERLIEELVENW